MRIMIVDGNAEMRAMIRHVVRGLCDEVFECQSGEEAMVVYDHWKPDLMLMEMQLPGMDGIDTMQSIMRSDPAAHVVFVTDVDAGTCRQGALNSGAMAVFSKENLIGLQKYIMQ